tara:strand:- start:80 stop:211 length:132 start_codon:yes stop_codon:yes gene_type:complete
MTMKTLKVNPVAYQMAIEASKKKRKNLENYVADLIQADYSGGK